MTRNRSPDPSRVTLVTSEDLDDWTFALESEIDGIDGLNGMDILLGIEPRPTGPPSHTKNWDNRAARVRRLIVRSGAVRL